MKKIIALALVAAMAAMTMVACGGDKNNETEADISAVTTPAEVEEATTPAEVEEATTPAVTD